jgi:hypothetical protein
MHQLPQELRPTGTFPIRLLSGENIALPLCLPSFKTWLGGQPPFTFGASYRVGVGDFQFVLI